MSRLVGGHEPAEEVVDLGAELIVGCAVGRCLMGGTAHRILRDADCAVPAVEAHEHGAPH